MLWVAALDNPELAQAPAVAVEAVQAEGRYNPYTGEGLSGRLCLGRTVNPELNPEF